MGQKQAKKYPDKSSTRGKERRIAGYYFEDLLKTDILPEIKK